MNEMMFEEITEEHFEFNEEDFEVMKIDENQLMKLAAEYSLIANEAKE